MLQLWSCLVIYVKQKINILQYVTWLLSLDTSTSSLTGAHFAVNEDGMLLAEVIFMSFVLHWTSEQVT